MRVASDPSHGAGHVSRSAALAAELAERAPVTVALDPGHATTDKFDRPGIDVVEAGREGAGPWLGAVLDGYGLPEEAIDDLARRAGFLAVMDDFLDPPAQADLAINAAIGLEGDALNGIPALLGAAYACLHRRFRSPSVRLIGDSVEHVVISLGMADPENVTGKVLGAFAALRADGFAPSLSVVMGPAAPHLAAVREQAAAMPGASVLVGVEDMAGLLGEADLVIGAGGVSLFERLALGVPSVTLTIAENQRVFVEGAVKRGATVDGGAFYAGASEPGSSSALARTIRALAEDPGRRAALRDAGRTLVDGRGAERVAARLAEMAQYTRPRKVGYE